MYIYKKTRNNTLKKYISLLLFDWTPRRIKSPSYLIPLGQFTHTHLHQRIQMHVDSVAVCKLHIQYVYPADLHFKQSSFKKGAEKP